MFPATLSFKRKFHCVFYFLGSVSLYNVFVDLNHYRRKQFNHNLMIKKDLKMKIQNVRAVVVVACSFFLLLFSFFLSERTVIFVRVTSREGALFFKVHHTSDDAPDHLCSRC